MRYGGNDKLPSFLGFGTPLDSERVQDSGLASIAPGNIRLLVPGNVVNVGREFSEGDRAARQFPDELPARVLIQEIGEVQNRLEVDVVDHAQPSDLQLVRGVKPIDKGPRHGGLAVAKNKVEIIGGTPRQIRFRRLQNEINALHADLFVAGVLPNRSGFLRTRGNHGVMSLAHGEDNRGKSGTGLPRSSTFRNRSMQKPCHLRVNSVADHQISFQYLTHVTGERRSLQGLLTGNFCIPLMRLWRVGD